MKKFISILLILFFFSQQSYAGRLDESGFYLGIECKNIKQCDKYRLGISTTTSLLNIKPKQIILFINHDIANKSLSILIPYDHRIYEAKLRGRSFKGETSHSKIEGEFNDNTIVFELVRRDRVRFFVATLSEELSIKEKQFLSMLIEKPKPINQDIVDQLKDDNLFLKDEIRNYQTLNKGLKKDIEDLKKQLQDAQ